MCWEQGTEDSTGGGTFFLDRSNRRHDLDNALPGYRNKASAVHSLLFMLARTPLLSSLL